MEMKKELESLFVPAEAGAGEKKRDIPLWPFAVWLLLFVPICTVGLTQLLFSLDFIYAECMVALLLMLATIFPVTKYAIKRAANRKSDNSPE
jgi:hypothetical protein